MNDIENMVQQLERGGIDPAQKQEWDRVMRGVTPDRFAQAVTDAMRQTAQQQYETHLNAADKGINSIGNLPREQQGNLAQALVDELDKIAVKPDAVSQASGVANLKSREMGKQDLNRLLGWVQVNHPQVLGSVAARYLDQPNLLARLLGAQTLMAIVSTLGVQAPAGQSGG